MKKPDLSIIILTYNTRQVTLDSVKSIEKNYPQEVSTGNYEVIVVDNDSTDDTLQSLDNYGKYTNIKKFFVVKSGGNNGFSFGNNRGVPHSSGRYVLFLNSDTIVYPRSLQYMVNFMDKHPQAGAASCKLLNKDGEIDFNCHRGFPTPWNSLCYFSGLQRMFPKNHLFAGYTQGWKDMDTTHEVDAVEGAFIILPRGVGEKVKWWDEDYMFNGEDIQLCYDIKRLGYKIYYVGEISILHIGGVSSGVKKKAQKITTATSETKRKFQRARFEALKIFYKKNYENKYPPFIKWLVFAGIRYRAHVNGV